MNLEEVRKLDRVHPYPAKFTVDLAIEKINQYSKEGDTVYDPFVGSGTTLLASKLLKRKSYGTDINHIAVLISQFKTLKLDSNNISNLESFIRNFESNYKTKLDNVKLYSYPSIEHWFCKDSILMLSLIKSEIDKLSNENERLFCKLVMSAIINTVSNQESDTRYAAVEKPKLNVDYVASVFIKSLTRH